MNTEEHIPEEILNKNPHFKEFIRKKDKFILDENNNVIAADLMTWGNFFEDERERRIVKRDNIADLIVSTVFIGLDHRLALPDEKEKEDYKPHIFETMIFKDDRDIYCERYSTWKEAEEGHQKAIDWINNGCKEEQEND